MKKTLLLTSLLAGIAQAAITTVEPHSIKVNGTTYTAGANTVIDFYLQDANGDAESWRTGATSPVNYTVLAANNPGDADKKGRYKGTTTDNLSNLGTLILASGTYAAEEGGAETSFVGGQIFLQCTGSISNDMILGSSGYKEGQYGGAIRFHASGQGNLVLTGQLTLAQDTNFCVGGDTNYIEGNISGAGRNLELTETGQLALSGGATLQTLAGTAAVVLDDKKSDTGKDAASKSYKMTNATGTGALTVDSGVSLYLTGHDSDKNLQTTSKAITNNGSIYIGETTTSGGTVVLTKSVSGSGTLNIVGTTGLRIENSVNQNLYMDGNGSSCNATVTIAGTGVLTAKNDFYMSPKDNAKIAIEKDGQFKRGSWTYTNENDTVATLAVKDGITSGKQYSCSSADFTVTGAKLVLDASDWNQVHNQLNDCSLVNQGKGEMRVFSELVDNKLNTVAVENGTVNFFNRKAAVQIDALTLGSGKNIGFYSGDKITTTTTAVQVVGSLSTTGDAIINASSLTLVDGTQLNLGGSVTLNGALILGEELTLSQSMISLLETQGSLTLFTGVSEVVDWSGDVLASNLFTNEEFTGSLAWVQLSVTDNKLVLVPEPTTATLSLLALAGLVARRRRK